jgi:hypothetical protein
MSAAADIIARPLQWQQWSTKYARYNSSTHAATVSKSVLTVRSAFSPLFWSAATSAKTVHLCANLQPFTSIKLNTLWMNLLLIGMSSSGNGGSECGSSVAKYVEATLHNVFGECDDWPR